MLLDTVRLDVCLQSVRYATQQAVTELFEKEKEAIEEAINKAFKDYDWTGAIKQEVQTELNRHARSFVNNSMSAVSKDWQGYKAIQDECDELVRVRLAELYLKQPRNNNQ